MHNTQETKVEQMMLEALLNDYNLLNNHLGSLTEEQLWKLIGMEITGRKRRSFVERIHQRYSKLKTARERDELLGGLK